jgi:hypothetical protein
VADAEHGGNRSQVLDAARDTGDQRGVESDGQSGTTARLEGLEVVRLELGEAPGPGGLLETLRSLPGLD